MVAALLESKLVASRPIRSLELLIHAMEIGAK
jgi:hypothetical protein